MPRCICEARPDAHTYPGKYGPGTLSTHRGVVHNNPDCPHSELRKTTKKHKPKAYKRVPGTRRILAEDVEQPKPKRRGKAV
jgi:hypothetical protein